VPSLAIIFSAVLIISCGQTDKHTEFHTDADDRYTHATTVSVSNNNRLGTETKAEQEAQLLQRYRATLYAM